jgi:hypothetical protein
MFEFSDLLVKQGLDPKSVLMIRHAPQEPQLKRVLPWLAAGRPDLWKAWQQIQRPSAEGAMTKAQWVAAFIGQEPGRATSLASPASPVGRRWIARAASTFPATLNSSRRA